MTQFCGRGETADARSLGVRVRKDVGVRVPPPAPTDACAVGPPLGGIGATSSFFTVVGCELPGPRHVGNSCSRDDLSAGGFGVGSVALWFEGGTHLDSDLGKVEGTVVAEYRGDHCETGRCCTVPRPLSRRVLLSRSLIDELRCTGHAHWRGESLLVLRPDHVAGHAARAWIFQLFAVRWREAGDPGVPDPELVLGVWPD